MTHVASEKSILTNTINKTCEVIHASMSGKLGGNQACGHVLYPAAHAFSTEK